MQPLTVIRVFLFSNARRVGIIIGNILFRILKPVTQFKFNNSTKLFKYRVLKRDIYLRKIPSDMSRMNEINIGVNRIGKYTKTFPLTKSPNVLIDLGANIGSASLAIYNDFPHLELVIGIEADRNNFNVLKKNFRLFEENSIHKSQFLPIYGYFNSDSKPGFFQGSINGSEYGSKQFAKSQKESIESVPGFGPYEISNLIKENDLFILKVDVEGSENEIFSKNLSWLDRCAIIIIEIHDRYEPANLLRSSNSFIKYLATENYAIIPIDDSLICINSKFQEPK
ncbi:MAG: FkbM family methyltransferase [Candidatus Marinimicrobia bacterium]|nr:FkbM family methyltransferase [Candidatus Neomarinimicrobiota bacterium]MDA1363870.1 FkbM family methyltransferase [Candidatus Neomarinimicrobiota bacterium]